MQRIYLSGILLLCTLAGISQEQLQERVHQLARLYAASGHHGSVLVATGGKIVQEEAFGYASQEPLRVNNLNTLYLIESSGKLFTACAVLQLVEKNKLRLEETVAYYLPDTRIRNAGLMTLHHLLTHQSGLTAPWENESFDFTKDYSREEWWDFIEGNRPAFDTPGKGVYYSTSAYMVLGEIIARVSGMPYEKYVEKYILRKAGMRNTHFSLDTASFYLNGAKPYAWLGMKTYHHYPQRPTIRASAGGGWISCPRDLFYFAEALLSGRLLSAASLKKMMSPHIEMPPGQYGYGMEIYTGLMYPGKKVYGHNGGGMGYSCDLFMEPETHTIVATCMNQRLNSRYVTGNFMKLAAGVQPDTPRTDKSRLLFDRLQETGIQSWMADAGNELKRLSIDSNDLRTLFNVADSYEILKDNIRREQWMRALPGLVPRNPLPLLRLGDLYVELHKKEAAIQSYREAKVKAEQFDPYWAKMATEKIAELEK